MGISYLFLSIQFNIVFYPFSILANCHILIYFFTYVLAYIQARTEV